MCEWYNIYDTHVSPHTYAQARVREWSVPIGTVASDRRYRVVKT